MNITTSGGTGRAAGCVVEDVVGVPDGRLARRHPLGLISKEQQPAQPAGQRAPTGVHRDQLARIRRRVQPAQLNTASIVRLTLGGH